MTTEVTWYKDLEEMRQALRGTQTNAPYEPKKVVDKKKPTGKRPKKKVNAHE